MSHCRTGAIPPRYGRAVTQAAAAARYESSCSCATMMSNMWSITRQSSANSFRGVARTSSVRVRRFFSPAGGAGYQRRRHRFLPRCANACCLVGLLMTCLLPPGLSQQVAGRDLAATPPMGWNSWDSYGLTIRDSEVRANAQWMAAHLKPYGWQYIVVDEGWYLRNPESVGKSAPEFTLDANGLYQPPRIDSLPRRVIEVSSRSPTMCTRSG